MVAVKAHEADRALARPDPSWRVFLFYGPDQGLVSERAVAQVRAVVGVGDDPFQVVRLDGSDLAADPMRLADEANTIGLFGGQRAIRVGATSRSLVSALDPVLRAPPVDAVIIIEAGDLPRTHALRQQIERAKSGLAVPCYADQARTLDALIDPVLHEFGITISRDARSQLLARLGADRQLSRREIEKLATYAMGQEQIETADVEAVVGDASARDVDDVVDGLFAGHLPRVDQALTRLLQEGEDASVLIGFAIRHATALLAARAAVEAGATSVGDAASGMRGVPFTRKGDIEAALRRWTAAQLSRGIATLHLAAAQARRHPTLAPELTMRALWNLTMLPNQR